GDWGSDVCSSDLGRLVARHGGSPLRPTTRSWPVSGIRRQDGPGMEQVRGSGRTPPGPRSRRPEPDQYLGVLPDGVLAEVERESVSCGPRREQVVVVGALGIPRLSRVVHCYGLVPVSRFRDVPPGRAFVGVGVVDDEAF